MAKIRILIADDHAVVRRGVALVLGLEPDFEIVGEVADGQQAVDAARLLRPDVILLDLKMPGIDGIAAAKAIKQNSPSSRILVLTGIEVNQTIFDALQAGADGYVLKNVSPDELARALRAVAAGDGYLHTAVTRHILRRLSPASPTPARMDLTPRERDVLRLLATSATNRSIANQLGISEETVRSHVKNILAKLGQPTRTQAVVAALKAALIELE